MTGARSIALLTGAALVVLACRPGDASTPTPRPAISIDEPARARCEAASADRDMDGLDDVCEDALADAFAPVLMQDPDDCAWTRVARNSAAGEFEGIAGGYAHAVQRVSTARVRLAYLPAYTVDCGWEGAKCILPGVDCDAHAGDSEAIVVEVEAAGDEWRPVGVFLSAHCFDGAAKSCRWYRDDELAQFEWDGARPVVWVSSGRHANYPSEQACDRGHYRLDTCDADARANRFPVDAAGNIGSAARPECRSAAISARDDASVECFWSGVPFRGWQADVPGVTSYLRYLDEIAGFVSPLDRLTWLAGCWERRGASSIVEEQWMAPRGGMMLGMGRVVRNGAVVDYETMRIEQRGDTLVFVANPSGQAEAEFTAAAIDDDGVVFENPDHDFPQRIVYRHAAGDSLHARIEGVSDGAVRGVDFHMGRTRCES